MVLGTPVADLGRAHLLTGDVDRAATFAERALGGSRSRKERGYFAWSMHVLGEIELARDPLDVDKAAGCYRQALVQATELGMRPLVAHCHVGLAELYRHTGKRRQAEEHFTTATTMYGEMGMTYWLERAERDRSKLG
jgi:hypothetical protein